MNEYIDIHNHMAWGIDDGVESFEIATNALELAKRSNISAIIATPHLVPGQIDEEKLQIINSRIEELENLANDFNIDIYKGNEIFLNDQYLEVLDKQLFNTLGNSKYVLVELDVRKDIDNNDVLIEEAIYEFKIRGYKPIIAHVERYFHNKIDINRVKSWIDEGAYIQVNRTSIVSGSKTKENANQLIKNNLVHIVASDAHSDQGRRIPVLDDCFEILSNNYGETFAKTVLYENPKKILTNIEMDLTTCEISKKTFWQKIWRKSK